MPNQIIPCPTSFPCAGSDSPFRNISSEEPDEPVYWAQAWRRNPPPLAGNTDSPGVTAIYECPVSSCTPADATTGAITTADYIDQNPIPAEPPLISPEDPSGGGSVNRDPTPLGVNPPPLQPVPRPYPPPPPNWRSRPVIPPPTGGSPLDSTPRVPPLPPTLYYNTPFEATATCRNGSVYVHHVPYGAYASNRSVSAANSTAQYYTRLYMQANAACLQDIANKACADEAYTDFLSTTGIIPTGYVLFSGQIPPGILLDNEGNLTGTPTTGGNYGFEIQADIAGGDYIRRAFSIRVLQISTGASLPNAIPGSGYNTTLMQVGGNEPMTWQTADPLPPGLTLSSTGIISGTPPKYIDGDLNPGGTYTFIVSCTDANSDDQTVGISCFKEFTIVVEPAVADGIDWSTLAWSVTVETSGAGVGNTGTFLGGVVQRLQTCMSPTVVTGSLGADVQANATITPAYVGPPVNCNMHVQYTMTANCALVNGGGLLIRIFRSGLPIATHQLFYTCSTVPVSVDVPFSIPVNAGEPITATFQQVIGSEWFAPGNPSNGGGVVFISQITITNL